MTVETDSRGAAKYTQPRVEAEGRNPGSALRLSSVAPKGRCTPPLRGYEIYSFPITQGSASLHPGLRVLRASGTKRIDRVEVSL